jgi:hypothetical protein
MPAGPHPDATRPLRALVPLKGSAHAKVALEPAAYLITALAAPAEGALHLTRVVKPPVTASKGRDQSARGFLCERTAPAQGQNIPSLDQRTPA